MGLPPKAEDFNFLAFSCRHASSEVRCCAGLSWFKMPNSFQSEFSESGHRIAIDLLIEAEDAPLDNFKYPEDEDSAQLSSDAVPASNHDSSFEFEDFEPQLEHPPPPARRGGGRRAQVVPPIDPDGPPV